MTQVLFLDQCFQGIVLRLCLAVRVRRQLVPQRVVTPHLVLVHQVVHKQDLVVELRRGVFLNYKILNI